MSTVNGYQGEKLWNDIDQSPEVIELGKLLGSGIVLDLGAGNGRNAFYLADQGFTVTAVERDTEKLNELQAKNDVRDKKIEVVDSDITTYQPLQPVDAIICDMVLHYLPSQDAVRSMIGKMQAWTKPGGYHLVTVYTDQNPAGKRPYLFKNNELRDCYTGWDILTYEEKPTDWFIGPGETEPRRNYGAWLLARKT